MLDIQSKCFSHFVLLDEICSVRSKIFMQQLWTLSTQCSTTNAFHTIKLCFPISFSNTDFTLKFENDRHSHIQKLNVIFFILQLQLVNNASGCNNDY